MLTIWLWLVVAAVVHVELGKVAAAQVDCLLTSEEHY
jgi:hypothetical protein